MAGYLRIRDETGREWFLEDGDPMWEALRPLLDHGYEYWQLVLPEEFALTLKVDPPNYDRVKKMIGKATDEEIGIALLVEDIRKILGG